jgi:LPXTG-motif cell wall-anchored protein
MAVRTHTRALFAIGATSLLSAGLFTASATPAFALGQTYVVTESITSFTPQPGELGWAIEQANATAGLDTIDIQVGTIALGWSLPDLTDDVTILGNGSIINASLSYTAFNLSYVSATISDLEIVQPNSAGVYAAPDTGDTIVLTDVSVTGSASYSGLYLSPTAGATVEVHGGTLAENITGLEIYGFSGGLVQVTGTKTDSNSSFGISIDAGSDTAVTLDEVTVDGGATTPIGMGLALYSDATVTLTGTTIARCVTYGVNAAVFADSTLSLSAGTTISDNELAGVRIYASGTVLVDQATIADNGTSGVDVDSLYDDGSVVIGNSTVSGNAGQGIVASIVDTAALEIVNSTVSGNTLDGIDVDSESTFRLRHSTVTGNGDSGVVLNNTGTQARITHSIVSANNTAAVPHSDLDISGTDVAVEWSVIGTLDDSAPSALVEGDGVQWGIVDPGLEPLADNGGLTRTHLPTASSAALDAGDVAVAGAPTTDQRGETRISAGRIDIGAVEVQPAAPAALAATGVESAWPLAASLALLAAGLIVLGRRRRVV